MANYLAAIIGVVIGLVLAALRFIFEDKEKYRRG